MGFFSFMKRSSPPSGNPKPTRRDSRLQTLVIELLASKDAVHGIMVIGKLNALGHEGAIETLVQVLRKRPGSLRHPAAKALARLGWKPVMSADKAILYAAGIEAEFGLEDPLTFASTGHVPVLIDALLRDSANGRCSSHVATLLGDIGVASEPVYQVLLCPLRAGLDGNYAVQRACLEALGKIGDRSVAEELRRVAEDGKAWVSDNEIRRAIEAMSCLSGMRLPGSVPRHDSCALCHRALDQDECVAGEAARGLARAMGDNPVPGARQYVPDVLAPTAMRCDRCGTWICNDCAVEFAMAAHVGQIVHKDCGGLFANSPDE